MAQVQSQFVAYLKANLQRDVDQLKQLTAISHADYQQWTTLINKLPNAIAGGIALGTAGAAAAAAPSPTPVAEKTVTPSAAATSKVAPPPLVQQDSKSTLSHVSESPTNAKIPSVGAKAVLPLQSESQTPNETGTKEEVTTQALPQRTSPVLKHLHHVPSPSLRRQQSGGTTSPNHTSSSPTTTTTTTTPQAVIEKPAPVLKQGSAKSFHLPPRDSNSRPSSAAVTSPLATVTSPLAHNLKDAASPEKPESPVIETSGTSSVAGRVSALKAMQHSTPSSGDLPKVPALVMPTVSTAAAAGATDSQDVQPPTPTRTTKPAATTAEVQIAATKQQPTPRNEKESTASSTSGPRKVFGASTPASTGGPVSPPSALANLIQKAHQQAQEAQQIIPKPTPSHSPFTGGPIVPKRRSTSQHPTVQVPLVPKR